jgi:transcriptional regulator with XRE-family HTH domain
MIRHGNLGGRPRSAKLCQIGQKIEAMAKRRGLNREQLAERAGLTYAGLWGVLTGRHRPKLDTAARIATALGVPVTRLVG